MTHPRARAALAAPPLYRCCSENAGATSHARAERDPRDPSIPPLEHDSLQHVRDSLHAGSNRDCRRAGDPVAGPHTIEPKRARPLGTTRSQSNLTVVRPVPVAVVVGARLVFFLAVPVGTRREPHQRRDHDEPADRRHDVRDLDYHALK
jgi:hypothetical protein